MRECDKVGGVGMVRSLDGLSKDGVLETCPIKEMDLTRNESTKEPSEKVK